MVDSRTAQAEAEARKNRRGIWAEKKEWSTCASCQQNVCAMVG
jgi:endonuclease YncB( thermonuclease family)